MAKIDFNDLARVALSHSRSLISDICPGGELIGKEYTCAGVSGGQGTSCKINIDTGKWADFATGEKGGDLISLWAASYGISQIDAAKALAGNIHYKLDGGVPQVYSSLPKHPKVQSEESIEKEYIFTSVPETVKEPNFLHYHFGAASAYWLYRGLGGERLFWIARYDTKDGKQFTPYSWCSNHGKIVLKSWPSNRPIYGLELLESNPGRAILIVEGEKAADAARKFIDPRTYTVVSWSGGSNGYSKTDWSPLFGRRILIWPDNDMQDVKTQIESGRMGIPIGERKPILEQPGMRAALGIADILAPHCEVKYFSLHEVPMIGEIPGFDAADAYEMAWTFKKFIEIVKPIVKVYMPPAIKDPEEKQIQWVPGSHFSLWSDASLSLDGKGKPHLNMNNVVRMLEFHDGFKGKIWFDEFHLKIFTTWKTPVPVEWSDMDDLEMCDVFQGELGFHKMADTTIRSGVRVYANKHRRNEPRDWISSLKWDGVPRLTEFFIEAFSALQTAYTRKASINFLVALVARVFEPGIKFDHMVILEGQQGKRKSSALEALVGSFFGESTEHIGSKDFSMCLQGKMIIEIPELSGFSNADRELAKKIITIKSDRFRPPYGASMVTYKRTSLFVGTTNESAYLQDETGARRFWPIKIGDIDLKYIEENRDQLFAEALVKFKEGFAFWEIPKEESEAEQEKRRIPDTFEESIQKWIADRYNDNNFTLLDVAAGIELNNKDLTKPIQARLTSSLRALGYDRTLVRINGVPKRVWAKKDSITILN